MLRLLAFYPSELKEFVAYKVAVSCERQLRFLVKINDLPLSLEEIVPSKFGQKLNYVDGQFACLEQDERQAVAIQNDASQKSRSSRSEVRRPASG